MPEMTKIHARRLLKLADTLEAVPRKEFDIREWGRDTTNKKGEVCGTVACAMGHACSVPSFRAAGLKLVFRSDRTFGATVVFSPSLLTDRQHADRMAQEYRAMHGDDSRFPAVFRGFGAGEAFFGLDEYTSRRLFSSEGYANGRPTPKQVARKIRSTVAEHHPELAAEAKKARKPLAA